MEKTYQPSEIEQSWYKTWEDNGYFKPSNKAGATPYTIMIPPPNVTGSLHMGHAFQDSIMDALTRYHRMKGNNTLWQVGTDHAGIATQMVVERKLAKEEDKTRHDLGREAFLDKIWEWKEESGNTITRQLRRLGASVDWDNERFTMDDGFYKAVQEVFVRLYKDDLIYRGKRLVNWDPKLHTAISDLEVENKDKKGHMWNFRYPLAKGDKTAEGKDYIVVATTRPETMLGDTGVAVNPKDPRYIDLIGKHIELPLVGRLIPIVGDDYADIEKGTGCVKITPAHDFNDNMVGKRCKLPMINIFDKDAAILAQAEVYDLNGNLSDAYDTALPEEFAGLDRFAARKAIVEKLDSLGLLESVNDHDLVAPYGDRSGVVIEPLLTDQWFVRAAPLAEPAIKAVEDGEIQFVPKQYENMYFSWMRDIQDWCISRQLWWGQRIPAFYYGDGDEDYVVTASADEALELAKAKTGNQNLTTADLKQDDDVMDTWFSSWLWPISVFDGFDPDSEDFKYYYPTNDLVTAPEILFFWVARMIIAGYEYKGEMPFKNVYLHGIVRDKQRRKMSKSLGNSPNPLDLIAEYGADGVRVGMLLCAPAGNDILYDDSLVEQGRNFSNKIWNAYRLIDGWEVDSSLEKDHSIAINWFENKFNEAMTKVEEQFSQFRISEALMTLYKLVWDDFCSWYLEMVKPPYLEKIDAKTYEATKSFFERLMLALHPIMPFITEELWQSLAPRKDGESISVLDYPKPATFNEAELAEMDILLEVVSQVRNIRNNRGMSPKVQIPLKIKTTNQALYKKGEELVVKMANLESLEFTDEKVSGAITFIIKNDECFAELEETINVEEELAKLSDELKRMQGFLFGVSKKLSNEKFVSFAPDAVVAMGKKKQADAVAKIKALEENIAELKG